HVAVAAPVGLVAAGHHRQPGETGDGDVVLVVRADVPLPGAERAVGALVLRQVGQAHVDGILRLLGDHPLGLAAVGEFLTVLALETEEGGTGNHGGSGNSQDRALTAYAHGLFSPLAATLF